MKKYSPELTEALDKYKEGLIGGGGDDMSGDFLNSLFEARRAAEGDAEAEKFFDEWIVEEKRLYASDLFSKAMWKMGPYDIGYDSSSYEMLDEKIRVLSAIVDGAYYRDVPGFFDILEKMMKVRL